MNYEREEFSLSVAVCAPSVVNKTLTNDVMSVVRCCDSVCDIVAGQ